jgi:hypothetical protein
LGREQVVWLTDEATDGEEQEEVETEEGMEEAADISETINCLGKVSRYYIMFSLHYGLSAQFAFHSDDKTLYGGSRICANGIRKQGLSDKT